MILYNYLFDILKYTVAGMGIVYIAFYLFKPYLDKSNTLQMLEFKKAVSYQTLPLRLQAYERLVLFIDRINPANLLIRLNGNGYSAAELHSIILNEVRTEYQHNVTQQIYVSTQAWAIVKRTKEDTLSLINNAVKAIPDNATGLDLGKVILTHLSKLDEDPYEIATNLVRKDLDNIF
ncbi:hypothetical protein GWR56_02305 [Mucilaginibacter sp. 14171R-50]|uniref:DUF7935 family protein n=1 Tax=Mucilaginibacter sp. 14171R-50 TaxID=2703789 RepID=UPI00138CEC7B|nr:hypothetical protein [Mucilaginibacter sp. 14171R-50]QHS54429.1 hypothetical protein GWR56_02305 [Mucilaginibacter sp. 14171R-50]